MKPDPAHPDFGVYIHWPFCAAKCPYCDFNSHVRHHEPDQSVFCDAYEREIAYTAELVPNRTVTSIFFGGGTPSLMQPQTVDRILNSISKHWQVKENTEITLEANPTSVEADRFKAYRAAGVNRVSLGIQSLRDEQLKFLGRLHTAEEAIEAIEIARNTFPRISFDLIYARPEQSLDSWASELQQAIDLAADHLSLYQLTIEQGTPFFELQKRGKLIVPDQDKSADLYELTTELTGNAGLPAYEISNYARSEAQCQHNLVYWRYQDYAGIGPGAHGRLSVEGKRIATVCQRNPEIWWQSVSVDGHGFTDQETLSPDIQADELLVMNLRLAEGLSQSRYETLSGHTFNKKNSEFLEDEGFIERIGNDKIRATQKGFLVLDAIAADLGMPDDLPIPLN